MKKATIDSIANFEKIASTDSDKINYLNKAHTCVEKGGLTSDVDKSLTIFSAKKIIENIAKITDDFENSKRMFKNAADTLVKVFEKYASINIDKEDLIKDILIVGKKDISEINIPFRNILKIASKRETGEVCLYKIASEVKKEDRFKLKHSFEKTASAEIAPVYINGNKISSVEDICTMGEKLGELNKKFSENTQTMIKTAMLIKDKNINIDDLSKTAGCFKTKELKSFVDNIQEIQNCVPKNK